MPRLPGVSDRDAGFGAKIAFLFTRRKLARLTGLGPDAAGMLEPLRMYAHIPGYSPRTEGWSRTNPGWTS